MGGYMSYQRMRSRNGLLHRKPDDDPDPYLRDRNDGKEMLIGDMNRMERDYLGLNQLPQSGADPGVELAEITGEDVETVRKILRAFFMEQR